VELIDRALAVGPVVSLQHQYGLLERAAEDEILPFALRRGLGVVVWAPLAMGFLTDAFATEELAEGDFRRTHPFAELDLEGVRAVVRSAGGTAAQGAIAWTVSHPAVTGAIVGVRNEREAFELADAARLRLTPNERATIASSAPSSNSPR
jgi:aryl-alcohol dehydrogenase-like predicted oxidoreductase